MIFLIYHHFTLKSQCVFSVLHWLSVCFQCNTLTFQSLTLTFQCKNKFLSVNTLKSQCKSKIHTENSWFFSFIIILHWNHYFIIVNQYNFANVPTSFFWIFRRQSLILEMKISNPEKSFQKIYKGFQS